MSEINWITSLEHRNSHSIYRQEILSSVTQQRVQDVLAAIETASQIGDPATLLLWRNDPDLKIKSLPSPLPPLAYCPLPNDPTNRDWFFELARRLGVFPRDRRDNQIYLNRTFWGSHKYVGRDYSQLNEKIHNILRISATGIPTNTYWHEYGIDEPYKRYVFAVTVNQNFWFQQTNLPHNKLKTWARTHLDWEYLLPGNNQPHG